MRPIYTKPNTPKRRRKPGAKQGHPGHRRKQPERIDQRQTHRLKRCPCCGGPLQRCQRKRTRVIEDIPEEIEPVVTEHTIWRDYCPKCKKHVEPVVPDALPRSVSTARFARTLGRQGPCDPVGVRRLHRRSATFGAGRFTISALDFGGGGYNGALIGFSWLWRGLSRGGTKMLPRHITMGLVLVIAAAGFAVFGAASPVRADDVDGDGVDDLYDVCDNTPPGTAVDAEGRPLGDIDLDCDNDLEDYALSQQGFTGPLAAPGVVIDTVTVGNPGNDGELSGAGAGGYGPDRICGAVDYVYNISKYEVTAGQYCAFLNAVAATDTYGLYNTSMDSSPYGCQITRNGTSGSYTYDFSGRPSGTEADWVDRPVNYVSWGDAARFANWLHNGQPTGAQDLTTTEDGSYYLNGAASDAALLDVDREPDATWVIPSEDEWYKAAYHKSDGVTGNYWDYPTASNSAPTSEAPPGTDMSNGSANYYDAMGSPYYRTEVGAYDAKPSDSPYGTFDQGGNVWEWNEAILYGSYRGRRGGSFFYNDLVDYLHAAHRNSYLNVPSYEYGYLGFRVAEVN